MGKTLKDIVSARLAELGRNPFEAARIGGLERSFVNDILIGRKRSVRGSNLVKLSKALDLTPADIILEAEGEQLVKTTACPTSVRVRGETAAGLWFEHDDLINEEPEPIPVIPGRYSNLVQFAYRVSGPSMNKKRIHHGDYVICVPYFEARMQPETGDIVVVERRRGHLIERSCKELQVIGDGYELWPRSTDARFQDPIRIKNRKDNSADDGTEIEIVGLVIAVHLQIGR